MEYIKSKTIKDLDRKVWVIAHNGQDVYHIGEVEAGSEFVTGLPVLEMYDTEEEMAEMINSYKKDVNYYAEYLKSLED